MGCNSGARKLMQLILEPRVHQQSGMEFVAYEELKPKPRRKCTKIELDTFPQADRGKKICPNFYFYFHLLSIFGLMKVNKKMHKYS